jgi:hypothetical protein
MKFHYLVWGCPEACDFVCHARGHRAGTNPPRPGSAGPPRGPGRPEGVGTWSPQSPRRPRGAGTWSPHNWRPSPHAQGPRGGPVRSLGEADSSLPARGPGPPGMTDKIAHFTKSPYLGCKPHTNKQTHTQAHTCRPSHEEESPTRFMCCTHMHTDWNAHATGPRHSKVHRSARACMQLHAVQVTTTLGSGAVIEQDQGRCTVLQHCNATQCRCESCRNQNCLPRGL